MECDCPDCVDNYEFCDECFRSLGPDEALVHGLCMFCIIPSFHIDKLHSRDLPN